MKKIDNEGRVCYSGSVNGVEKRVANVREIGGLLRTERKRQGITIAQLAGLAAVSPRFLGELERGVRDNVSADKLVKLLALLNLEIHITGRT